MLTTAQKIEEELKVCMLRLNETGLIVYGKQFVGMVMLRRYDGHVLRRKLDFEVDGLRKKGRLNRTWSKHIEV